jgi:hypothetical protein
MDLANSDGQVANLQRRIAELEAEKVAEVDRLKKRVSELEDRIAQLEMEARNATEINEDAGNEDDEDEEEDDDEDDDDGGGGGGDDDDDNEEVEVDRIAEREATRARAAESPAVPQRKSLGPFKEYKMDEKDIPCDEVNRRKIQLPGATAYRAIVVEWKDQYAKWMDQYSRRKVMDAKKKDAEKGKDSDGDSKQDQSREAPVY